MTNPSLIQLGDVIWADFSPTIGKEQRGERPALVISNNQYNQTVTDLIIVLPITSINRNWPNHLPIDKTVLNKESFAMTEQPRTISKSRVLRKSGQVSANTLSAAKTWCEYFIF